MNLVQSKRAVKQNHETSVSLRATISAEANQIQNVSESQRINQGELSRKGKLGASSYQTQRIYTVKKERNEGCEYETGRVRKADQKIFRGRTMIISDRKYERAKL